MWGNDQEKYFKNDIAINFLHHIFIWTVKNKGDNDPWFRKNEYFKKCHNSLTATL